MSGINVEPYIFFRGDCRAAMEFYKSIFGGELFFQTYSEAGNNIPEGVTAEQVMHASLKGGDAALMASDTAAASEKAAKVSISLAGKDEEKLTTIFNGLSQDVEVTYPLKKEFWGDIFGSVVDKYGVEWMVNISGTKAN